MMAASNLSDLKSDKSIELSERHKNILAFFWFLEALMAYLVVLLIAKCWQRKGLLYVIYEQAEILLEKFSFI